MVQDCTAPSCGVERCGSGALSLLDTVYIIYFGFGRCCSPDGKGPGRGFHGSNCRKHQTTNDITISIAAVFGKNGICHDLDRRDMNGQNSLASNSRGPLAKQQCQVAFAEVMSTSRRCVQRPQRPCWTGSLDSQCTRQPYWREPCPGWRVIWASSATIPN